MFEVLKQVAWRSPTLASFEALSAEIDARFGPPSVRDLDSNGVGPFDATMLRFSCGLEIALWRFHLTTRFRSIDPDLEPSRYEVYSSEVRDLDHIAFHLELAVARMTLVTDGSGRPLVHRTPPAFAVMRTDDNGNHAEVTQVSSRCEADSVVARYERRGHKQSYWIAAMPAATR